MAGITRFIITDQITGPGSWRFEESKKRYPAAVKLYREIFEKLNAPLAPRYEEILVTRQEFEAGYDYELGIDVIFEFENGMKSTLQEKFLFKGWKTVTVEYMQNPLRNEEGDWFNLKAQYYFVGYDRIGALEFQDWILLNWPYTQLATQRDEINWRDGGNKNDGAKANFKYEYFGGFPGYCRVADSDSWLNIDVLQLPFEELMA